MSYRDDLAAAHARIEALEAQLGASADEVADLRSLVARTVALQHELETVQAASTDLRAAHERLIRAVQQSSADMPTLNERNRQSPPGENAMSGKPSGVCCPMCRLLFGETIQMRIAGNLRIVLWQNGEVGGTPQTVRCPRCDYLGLDFSS